MIDWLTFDNFMRWLENQPLDAEVGISCIAMACPISQWAARQGVISPNTRSTHISGYQSGNYFIEAIPDEFQQFIRAIDNGHGPGPVTAIAASEICDRILSGRATNG